LKFFLKKKRRRGGGGGGWPLKIIIEYNRFEM